MIKKINGIQYNVDEITQMTFEQFRSTCTGYSDEQIKKLYEEITNKKIEKKSEPIKKAKEIKIEEKEI